MTITHVLQAIIGLATFGAIVYYLLCIFTATGFFLESKRSTGGRFPPVSLMIPLCGADPDAYRNYVSYCRQDYPEFQIVFGVRDSEDSSVPIVRKLMVDFPQVDIALTISSQTIGPNLKVSNLENMLAAVKHEHIVIVDSDVRVEPDYLRAIILPLEEQGVGLVTCPYRSASACNWPTLLQALWVATEFMPSVFVARRLEGMRYALGATMATTRQRLSSLGGFKAMADHVADDYILGHLVWRKGGEVRLVNYVVETLPPSESFLDMLKHQIRWSRTIKACRPGGHFGLVLTYGVVLAILNVIVAHASPLSLRLLGTVLVLRLTCTWLIGIHWLRDRNVSKYFWLVPFNDLLTFAVWVLSYAGRKVEWRGRLFELDANGKLVDHGRSA